jgi:hypothetical protein
MKFGGMTPLMARAAVPFTTGGGAGGWRGPPGRKDGASPRAAPRRRDQPTRRSTADSGKEVTSMASGQDRLNAGHNPILRILIIYLIRRTRERRRERQLTRRQ